MKATGIVRRIDDLGRIVIPKEIRGTGALVCFVQDDLPLNREVSAIPISYL